MRQPLLYFFLLQCSIAFSQPFNPSLKLDGTDDQASLNTSLLPSRHDFTVETYFYSCNAFITQYIFDMRNGTSGYGLQVRFNGSGFNISFRDSATGSQTLLPSNTVPESKWNHIAFVHSNSDSMNHVYLNGIVIDSAFGLVTPGSQIVLGQADHSVTGNLKGYLEEFRISDTIRYYGNFSPDTLAFNVDANTIALWHFDESEGSTTFFDATSNNHDLTGNAGCITRFAISNYGTGPDKTICLGDSAQLYAFGGDSYTWLPPFYLNCDTCNNPKASPVFTSPYEVVIQKDSLVCSVTDTQYVYVDTIPQLMVSGDTVLCKGESTTLTASGASTYMWSGATIPSPTATFTPNDTSTYFVVGTDGNNCSDTVFQQVIVNIPPDTSVTDLIGALMANDSTSGVTYQWLDCDSNYMPIPSATTQIFTPTKNGNYALVVSNSNCTDTSSCKQFFTWGIEDLNGLSFELSPNPSNHTLVVNIHSLLSLKNEPYTLIDLTGKVIHTGLVSEGINRIDVSSFDIGVYFLQIRRYSTKVVIMR